MVKLVKRLILSVVTVLVATVTVLALALQYLNWNDHRDALAGWLSVAINREVTISDSLDFQLWPVTRLEVSGLRLASPADTFDVDLLELRNGVIEFDLWSLFSGIAVINRLQLDGPTLQLAVSADGLANWHFDREQPSAKLPPVLGRLVARNVLIKDARLVFAGRDPRLHQDLYLERLTLTLPSRDEGSEAVLIGSLNGAPLALAGSLTLKDDDLEATLDLSLGAMAGKVHGSVNDLMEGANFDLAVDLKTRDLTAAMQVVIPGLSARNARLLDGSAAVTAYLRGRPDRNLRLENVDITTESSLLRLTTSGSLSLVRPSRRGSEPSSRFQVLLETEHLGELVSLYKGKVPFAATAQAQGTLSGSLGNFRIDDVVVKAEGEYGRGEATGRVEQLGASGGPWVEFATQATTNSLGPFLKAYGLDLPYVGRASASARVSGRPGDTHVTEIDLKLNADSVSLKATGSIGPLGKQAQFKLPFSASADDIAALAAPFGLKLPLSAKGEVNGVLTGQRRNLHVTEIDLNINADPVSLKATGTIGPLGKQAQFNLPFSATADDIAALAAPFGLKLPLSAKGEVNGALTGDPDALALTELAGILANDLGRVSFDGAVESLAGPVRLDVTVDVSISDIGAMGRLLELPLDDYSAIGAKGSARIQHTAERTSLTKLRGTLAGNGIRNGRFSGEVPDLTQLGASSLAIDVELVDIGRFAQQLHINPSYADSVKLKASLVGAPEPNAPYFLTLDIKTDALKALIHGQVSALEKGAEFNLKGRLETDDVIKLNHLLNSELPGAGPLSLYGTVHRPGGATQLLKSHLNLDATGVSASVAGALAWPLRSGMKVDTRIEAKSLANLDAFLPGEFPDLGPMVFSGSLSLDDQGLHSDHFSLTVANNNLGGSLSINGLDIAALPQLQVAKDDKLRLSGELNSKRLSLIELFPPPPETIEKSTPEGPVFSDAPLPLEWITDVDLAVAFKAEQLIGRKAEAGNLSANIQVLDGVLTVNADSGQLSGGRFDMDLMVDAREDVYTTKVGFKIEEMEIEQIPELRDKDLPIRGQINVDIDLAGQGKSLKQMLAGANGSVSMSGSDAYIPASGLDFLTQSILSQIFRVVSQKKKSEYHEIECGLIGFRVIDGAAISRETIVIKTPEVVYLVRGGIHFDDESIVLAIQPKALKGFGVSAASLTNFYRVGGTLTQSRIEADPEGLLKTGATWGLAAATAGISIVAQGLFDRFTGNLDVCKAAQNNYDNLLLDTRQEVLQAITDSDNDARASDN
ncbi:MAG: AsmA family protein [Acidiferrobacteraceae bacterium]|nr:AsmA family protein [Acidiferrobacteraceae bacterium]